MKYKFRWFTYYILDKITIPEFFKRVNTPVTNHKYDFSFS